MKKLLLTLLFVNLAVSSFLFLNGLSFSQKIEEGSYLSVYDYDPVLRRIIYYDYSEKIIIKNDSSFEYNYIDDVSNDVGFGKYTLSKGKFTLDFGPVPEDFDTLNYKITSAEITSEDSVRYQITVYTANKLLKDYFIVFKKINEEKFLFPTKLIKNGIITFKLCKCNLPGTIEIHDYLFGLIKYNVVDSLDRNINVSMVDRYSIIRENRINNYDIKEIYKNGFYLKGGIWKDWTFFLKNE